MAEDVVDLTICDREPIHIVGRVQAFGALIAVSMDWIITQVSENARDLLDLEREIEIGQPLPEVFSAEVVHTIRTKLQSAAVRNSDHRARIFGLAMTGTARLFDVSVHAANGVFIIEFERKPERERDQDMALVQALIGRIGAQKTLESRCQLAARSLRALTDFDRVMVYRFQPDGSGEVIAEHVAVGMEPYLGLRYPASDIPRQARALYLRSPLRLIADVDAPTYAVQPGIDVHGNPLDMSLAVTRAVSPIHLEYLRNMGVQASMSVSIIVKGELWGLMACHHEAPKHIDFQLRSMVELFTQLFTYELAQGETETELAEADRARDLQNRLMGLVSTTEDLTGDLELISSEVADVIRFDGMAIYSGGRYAAEGVAPSKAEFMPMARFLNTATGRSIYSTDRIAGLFDGADLLSDRIAGVLALPISRSPRDYILFFRREVAQTVMWAGNPDKPVVAGPLGARLTPRESFAAWQQEVSDTSEAWTPAEIRIAEALRVSLLEIILKISDEAVREKKRAAETQELLIAELNHRVRNILNLIQGLMAQTSSESGNIQDYTARLGQRVQSLARAHDQLTRNNWDAASLHALIEVETKAFATGRVTVSGADVGLKPTAYSTFALLIHELMTNAIKHGSLSGDLGMVDITIDVAEDGTLELMWAERGGPVLSAPAKQGFGTVIVERSVEYELGGSAEIEFRPTGLAARFVVPARHICEPPSNDAAEPPAVEDAAISQDLTGDVLLVEDSMIIAMDTADLLSDLGASRVHTASTARAAMRILDEVTPTVAFLDVNLGSETSIPVAERLRAAGIPFCLATGYGGAEAVLSSYPDVPVLQKPYGGKELQRAIGTMLASKR